MEGKCYFCNKDLTNRMVKRHIGTCKDRLEILNTRIGKNKNLKEKFILKITSKYNPSDYYLYVGIDKAKELKDLDQFLRDVWLECCGHLSGFKIDGEFYNDRTEADFWGMENDMSIKLGKVIELSDKFGYEYDFGSTTELVLEVIDEYKDSEKTKGIEILARSYKGKRANSPREGVCGYSIGKDDDFKYLPEKLYIV
ncbi:MAG: IS1096 element passenger TnpR family protein [Sarcina sp.]